MTTIEGLSPDGAHAVQRAWEELDVPQCGYCQAGQMMAAAALLAKTPKPTDADIDAAMNVNLCRCATYLRIRKAVHRAAEIKGGAGAVDLGRAVIDACEVARREDLSSFKFLYPLDIPVKAKIEAICLGIYGAAAVTYSELAEQRIAVR